MRAQKERNRGCGGRKGKISSVRKGGDEKAKKAPEDDAFKKVMVRPRRFERLTHSLEGCCSILLSYGRVDVFLLDDLF